MGLKTKILIAALSALALGTGCSKSSSGDSPSTPASTALTISGNLSIDGTTSSGALAQKIGVLGKLGNKIMGKESAFTASYALSCSTFELPPVACGMDIPSSGVINLTCDNYASKPFGCFIYNTSTYQNYSVVFNVKGSDSNTLTSTAGTIDFDVNLDTTTGVASADIVLPTVDETGTTSGTFTLADLQMLDGTYQMAPSAWSSV